jgi:hypothetical protein
VASLQGVFSQISAPVQSTGGKPIQSERPSSRPPAHSSMLPCEASPATTAASVKLRSSSTPSFHGGGCSPAADAALTCASSAANTE